MSGQSNLQRQSLLLLSTAINSLQKKAFVAALTRGQTVKQTPDQKQNQTPAGRGPEGSVVQSLIDVRRFSDLSKLVKTIAWVWRAAKRFFGPSRTLNRLKWKAIPSSGMITLRERKDALCDLFLAAEEGAKFPNTTTDRLVVFKEQGSGLLVFGRRVQSFEADHVAALLLPCHLWVSTLLARESDGEGHDAVAGTLLKMSRRAWVIRGRTVAQKIVDACLLNSKSKKVPIGHG